MLINSDLTQLSKEDIIQLLEETGYTGEDIISVEYGGNTENGVKYVITFTEDDKLHNGLVYVYISKGKLECEY